MSQETSIRLIKLLTYIPKYPAKRSLSNFKEHLESLGYEVTDRTIQRDLLKLEKYFPLLCDDRNPPYGWSWQEDAKEINLSAMDKVEALSLSLAEKYLEPLMPIENYERIRNLFDRANNTLESSEQSQLKKWRDRVRVLPQSQRLEPPLINQEVQSNIYDALLNGEQLDVQYLKANSKLAQKRIVNPLGIVLMGIVHRLICTMDPDFKIIRHLPLHRFKTANANGETSIEPENFDIDDYLDKESLSFLRTEKKIKIELLFRGNTGFHLSETPVSKDQKYKEEKNGKIRISGTVADTEQLRWWILGFGENVEVIKPSTLRDEIALRVKLVNAIYS
jgi:predicted DNA-binding transcriptional regulator YafY